MTIDDILEYMNSNYNPDIWGVGDIWFMEICDPETNRIKKDAF